MSVHATSPLPAVRPRHLRPDVGPEPCPAWCDEYSRVKSVHGGCGIHIGAPMRRFSDISDVEFEVANYKDVGEPEALQLTLRRIATSGPIKITVSLADLQWFVAAAEQLGNDEGADSEAAAEVNAGGVDSGAHTITG